MRKCQMCSLIDLSGSWHGCAWLLLCFSPFPVLNPVVPERQKLTFRSNREKPKIIQKVALPCKYCTGHANRLKGCCLVSSDIQPGSGLTLELATANFKPRILPNPVQRDQSKSQFEKFANCLLFKWPLWAAVKFLFPAHWYQPALLYFCIP